MGYVWDFEKQEGGSFPNLPSNRWRYRKPTVCIRERWSHQSSVHNLFVSNWSFQEYVCVLKPQQGICLKLWEAWGVVLQISENPCYIRDQWFILCVQTETGRQRQRKNMQEVVDEGTAIPKAAVAGNYFSQDFVWEDLRDEIEQSKVCSGLSRTKTCFMFCVLCRSVFVLPFRWFL